MSHIADPVTSRDLNQHSGKLMERSRMGGEIIPVTFGRNGRVENYIVPNSVEAAQALVELLAEEREQGRPHASSNRERFLAARKPLGGKVADTLDRIRAEESQ